MKKTFLLIALLLTMGTSAFAGGDLFNFGIKAGYKTSRLSYQKADIQAGFANNLTIGVFARVNIGGFYIQPELLWYNTSNAFDLNTSVSGDTIGGIVFPTSGVLDFTLKSTNFQLPILLGYKFDLLNILALRAHVGPTLNFTIPQKTIIHQTVGDAPDVEIPNETFDTKSIAFGLQGGFGVDILSRLTLDVNYNFGITKVFGANIINNTQWGQYVDTNNISDEHTHMWMVTIGYKIL